VCVGVTCGNDRRCGLVLASTLVWCVEVVCGMWRWLPPQVAVAIVAASRALPLSRDRRQECTHDRVREGVRTWECLPAWLEGGQQDCR
jgi:hypothetical protein